MSSISKKSAGRARQFCLLLMTLVFLWGAAGSARADLVARFTFDDPANLGEDSAGGSVDHSMTIVGTITTSTQLTTGMTGGYAADFGSNKLNHMYFDPPANDPIRTRNMTVSLWAYTPTIDLNAKILVAWDRGGNSGGDTVINSPWCFNWMQRNTGDPDYMHPLRLTMDAGHSNFNTVETFDQRVWRHVTMTSWYDPDVNKTYSRLFVDGRAIGLRAETSDGISTGSMVDLLRIGSRGDSDIYNFTGLMDDVQFYNRRVGVDEVEWLYLNPGKTLAEAPVLEPDPIEPTLIARYEFENPVQVGEDTAGHPEILHMDMIGTVTLDTEVPAGMPGGSRSGWFGTDKLNSLFTDLPSSSGLRTRNVSVSLWSKVASQVNENTYIVAWDDALTRGDIRIDDPWNLHWLPSATTNHELRLNTAHLHNHLPGMAYPYLQWRHVVMVLEYNPETDNTRSRLYVDGQPVGAPGGLVSSRIMTRVANDYLRIGSRGRHGASFNSFRGWLDDVQIYAGALDADQVAYLYKNPGNSVNDIPEPIAPQMIARYEFKDGGNLGKDTALDPVDHNMLKLGTLTQSSDVPTSMPVGARSLFFPTYSGSGQGNFLYMIPDTNDPIRSRDFSVSLWCKSNATDDRFMYLTAWDNNDNNVPWGFYFTPNPHQAGTTKRLPTFVARYINSGDPTHENRPNLVGQLVETSDWVHMAMTCAYDMETGLTTSKLFANGVKVAELTNSFAMNPYSALDQLRIGSRGALGNQSFSGYMADVQIYNYTLEESDLLHVAQNPGATAPWRLDYYAGAGGSIVGSSAQVVLSGDGGTTVVATPDNGYRFDRWSDGYPDPIRIDTNVQGNVLGTAHFLEGWTLTYVPGTGGTITGAAVQRLNPGDDGSSVTAVASAGYRFDQWSDGVPTASRTDLNNTDNLTVTALFIKTWNLSYTAGTGGSITGTLAQVVDNGANGTQVTAVAGANYRFVQWSDGVPTAARTETNVSANIGVTAQFIRIWTLTYTAGTGGTISGTTPQTVDNAANGQTVTAVPNAGWRFDRWSDGILTAARAENNVTGNISVAAQFIRTWTLTYTAGTGGSITGTSPQTVDQNGSGSAVSAVAASGYRFLQWSDNVLTATRTDTNVTANVSATAQFVKTWTLTFGAATGGSVTGSSPQIVDQGGSCAPVTAVPAAGWRFDRWSDGVLTATREDVNVSADIAATAQFIKIWTLNYTPAPGGTITGTLVQVVDQGTSGAAVTAVPDSGRAFQRWSDGVLTATRTDTNVTSDVSVTAIFINTLPPASAQSWTLFE